MRLRTKGIRSRGLSLWGLGFTLLLTLAAGTRPAARAADSTSGRAVAPREPALTQYRAYRRMHAQSEHFGQEAWLDAWTEQDGRGFRYTVVSESGSEYIRNKVLKEVLRREQELVDSGECRRSELTPENYVFTDGERADGERYVELKPRRKDVLLVDGRMVISDGGELLRVEGQLSKNPSFWTSLVSVIRHYARLDGVRVPISTESVAKVKFAGTSHLEVHYEYETINGRPVSLEARRAVSALPPRPTR
ncbi:MAG: hypothetical protein V7647_1654 [Acidobacteriota bacterium]